MDRKDGVTLMAQFYTSGDWRVKEGCRDEFIERWRAFASWTSENVSGASTASLLRDSEDPQVFRSFGAWESPEAIADWRASEGFKESLAGLQPLLESLNVKSLEAVVIVG